MVAQISIVSNDDFRGLIDIVYGPRRLLTFRVVAHARSFSRAAEGLSLTQPSVSHQIALLETEVGVRLLQRGRGGLRLTGAGEVLLEHADHIAWRSGASRHTNRGAGGSAPREPAPRARSRPPCPASCRQRSPGSGQAHGDLRVRLTEVTQAASKRACSAANSTWPSATRTPPPTPVRTPRCRADRAHAGQLPRRPATRTPLGRDRRSNLPQAVGRRRLDLGVNRRLPRPGLPRRRLRAPHRRDDQRTTRHARPDRAAGSASAGFPSLVFDEYSGITIRPVKEAIRRRDIYALLPPGDDTPAPDKWSTR